MKSLLALIAVAFGLTACQTPQQRAASLVYAAGYASSFDNLNHNAALVATIQDVAAKLPDIPTAKLTNEDRGKLDAEIKILIANNTLLKSLVPADTAKLDQAISYLSGFVASVSSTNGAVAPTVDQVLLETELQQFAAGLTGGIDYWKGHQGVVAP